MQIFRDERINRELANRLVQYVDPEPKQCFRNSIYAMSTFTLRNHDVWYAEGHVYTNVLPLPIEHGFLIVDGKVVDVTLPGARGPYIAVYRFRNPLLSLERLDTDILPLFWEINSRVPSGWLRWNLGYNELLKATPEGQKLLEQFQVL